MNCAETTSYWSKYQRFVWGVFISWLGLTRVHSTVHWAEARSWLEFLCKKAISTKRRPDSEWQVCCECMVHLFLCLLVGILHVLVSICLVISTALRLGYSRMIGRICRSNFADVVQPNLNSNAWFTVWPYSFRLLTPYNSRCSAINIILVVTWYVVKLIPQLYNSNFSYQLHAVVFVLDYTSTNSLSCILIYVPVCNNVKPGETRRW
jgi:hypothetical protein